MYYIKKYFANLEKSKLDKLFALENIYKYWNSKVNLISRKDISNLYLHHVLHSLFIYKVAKFKEDETILDLGTGGGFPGIPLAIVFPHIKFTLLDSMRKKVNILEDIRDKLSLKNVKLVCDRSEDFDKKYDFVLGRFVSDINKFFSLAKKHSKKGIYYLKGGDTNFDFLVKKKNAFREYNLDNFFEEEYFCNKKLIHISF